MSFSSIILLTMEEEKKIYMYVTKGTREGEKKNWNERNRKKKREKNKGSARGLISRSLGYNLNAKYRNT